MVQAFRRRIFDHSLRYPWKRRAASMHLNGRRERGSPKAESQLTPPRGKGLIYYQ